MSAWSHTRRRLVVSLGLVFAGLMGAWALPAQAELTPPLTVQWIKSMGAEPDNDMSPLVLGDRLYLTHDGSLYCLDPLTGAQVWKLTVQNADVSTAPLAWNETVIIGLNSGYLLAVKAQDGSIVWKTDCGGRIAPTPVILDDLLMLAAGQTAFALTPADGKTKWACTLSSAARYGPVTEGANLFFRCLDGSLQSVDASTGRFRWRVTLPAAGETYPPVLADHHVILAEGSTVYSVARSGQITWSRSLDGAVGGPSALVGNSLYVPCSDGRIVVLNPRTGLTPRGPSYAVEGSATAAPVVTDTLLFAGTSGALVYALDRATGARLWQYRCRTPEQPVDDAATFGLYAPLVTVNGRLIALTGGGDLYCFASDAPDTDGPLFAELRPEPGEALPGESAVISFAVFDDGTGVMPDSVTVTVDGLPLTPKFDVDDGVATAVFSKPKDDIHIVKVTAKDYRGNVASKEWSFLTDLSLNSTEEERTGQNRPRAGNATGNRPGGQARPGRGPGGG